MKISKIEIISIAISSAAKLGGRIPAQFGDVDQGLHEWTSVVQLKLGPCRCQWSVQATFSLTLKIRTFIG